MCKKSCLILKLNFEKKLYYWQILQSGSKKYWTNLMQNNRKQWVTFHLFRQLIREITGWQISI